MLKVPTRLIAITRSKSASGIGPSRPTMRLAGPMPAQLTRMRATPCRSRACFSAADGVVGAGDVAADGEPADLVGVLARAVEVDVEQRHLGAGAGKRRGGLGAEAGGASGDDGGVSFGVHVQFPFVDGDHVGGWRLGIKLLDQRRAAGQHRALVDRALVGGLAGVERRRLRHQDEPADAGRAAGALARERIEPAAELVAQFRIGQHRGGRRVGGKPGKLAAGLDVGKHQRGDVVAVGAGDHRVAHERRAMIDEPRAQRAGADPGAAEKLEVLGDAAVEQQALARIGGVDELQRVADLVVALLVERVSGQIGPPPIAGRDVGALSAALRACLRSAPA